LRAGLAQMRTRPNIAATGRTLCANPAAAVEPLGSSADFNQANLGKRFEIAVRVFFYVGLKG